MSATAPLRDDDPRQVGDYRLTARLGQGGQGVVYLGADPGDTRVAVKLLHRDLVHDTRRRARLAKEVDTARRVARFCTAQILDADIANDPPYVVSEFIEGPSLHAVVRDEGPLTGSRLERLAVGTVTALAAIHRAGIVHRDFKPGNVLLGPDGPRVIDFGIARTVDTGTQTSSIVGTPAYMAPEQVSGGGIGPAADVFAWGSTMVFAATAHAPFGEDTLPGVVHRLTAMPPELGPLDGPLRSVIERCLAKNPRERPSSAEVLMSVLGGGALVLGAPADTGGPLPEVTELPTPTLQAGMHAASGAPPAARAPGPPRPHGGALLAPGPVGNPPGGPSSVPPGGPSSVPPGASGIPSSAGQPAWPNPAPRPRPPAPPGRGRPGGEAGGVLLFLGVLALVAVLVAVGVAIYLSQQGGQRPPSDRYGSSAPVASPWS